MVEVGFYGKLPSHGDFVRRRTSDAFVRAWDEWLQHGISSSRAAFGDKWLDLYLTSPVWRFACAPGVAGPAAVVGVMAPSVDRVGRYFPVTLVAEIDPAVNLLAVATDVAPYFAAAEQLIIETLDTEHVDFERFDTLVSRLADHLQPALHPPVMLDPAAAAALLGDGQPSSWQLPISDPDRLGSVLAQVMGARLAARHAPLVLWWTGGSSDVEPSCLVGQGLPSPDAFGALLNGAWMRHRWRPIAAAIARSDALPGPLPSAPALRLRSAAATDVGRVRRINQDAFVERPDAGLWVVADGLGGHTDGEVASRMVCDALTDFVPGDSFDATVEALGDRLQQVNEHLLRTATRSLLADRCGSTVVVLLIRHERLAVVWAGDSRAYRWRSGQLEQLTTDHSSERPSSGGRPELHAVTRAVGAEPQLVLDVVWEDLRAGDRYLLCTDGLTRMLSDARIAEWMMKPDIQDVVDGLIRSTLDEGAPDNTTVLVAEAVAEPPR